MDIHELVGKRLAAAEKLVASGVVTNSRGMAITQLIDEASIENRTMTVWYGVVFVEAHKGRVKRVWTEA